MPHTIERKIREPQHLRRYHHIGQRVFLSQQPRSTEFIQRRFNIGDHFIHSFYGVLKKGLIDAVMVNSSLLLALGDVYHLIKILLKCASISADINFSPEIYFTLKQK